MSPIFVDNLNFVLAAGGVVLLIAVIGLFIDLFFYKGMYAQELIVPWATEIVIALSVASVIMSLLYSDVLGFVPCSLCWFQRIFIYPQAFMSITGKWLKDTRMLPRYGIVLSIAGMGFSLYQYVLQMAPIDNLPCPADGSASCADKVINEFGFMTFPLISAIVFTLLIAIYIYMLRYSKK